MNSSVEVIDIDSSDDSDQDLADAGPAVKNETDHSVINNIHHDPQNTSKLESQSPNSLSDSRRKKIDDLLDLFDTCRSRLMSSEHLMNAEQRQRWSAHQPNIIFNLPQMDHQLPSYSGYEPSQSPSLLDHDREDFFGLPRYNSGRQVVARRPKTVRRRFRRKKTTRSPRKAPAAARTVRPKAAAAATVKVKRESKPVIRVKKEH